MLGNLIGEIPETPAPEGRPHVNKTLDGTREALGEDSPWDTNFKMDEPWTNIFPFEDLVDGKIPSLDPPHQKQWEDTAERAKMREDLTSWFMGSILGQDKSTQMAGKVIKLAKKESQVLNLKEEQVATARAFLRHLRDNIGPESKPPPITHDMPPLAPTKVLMTKAGERLPANRHLRKPGYGEKPGTNIQPARLNDTKVIWQGLRDMYEIHKWEVAQRNDWIDRDTALMRYYAEALTSAGEKDRTYYSTDLKDMTRCTMPSCKFTQNGKETTFMPKPDGEYDEKEPTDEWTAFRKHWYMPADPRNGRPFESFDYRDDGRGNTNRLERYAKAFDNHQKHAHINPKNVQKEEPPEFKMKMTPEEFEEHKEQWRRYNQVYSAPTAQVQYEMLRRSIHVELWKVLKFHLEKLDGKFSLGGEQEKRIFDLIEQNAVTQVPNEKYLKEFEAIKQENGEKIDPFLSRLRTAAAKVHIKKRGTCSKETCKGSGGTFPCKEAEIWYEAINQNEDRGDHLV